MIKALKILLLIFVCNFSLAQKQNEIILSNENLGKSFSQSTFIIEDADRIFSAEDVLKLPDSMFYQPDRPNPILQFSTSRFWIKFLVTNNSDHTEFFLETARPITDTIIFYEIAKNGSVLQELRSGDDFCYHSKSIQHRKNLFGIELCKGETREFIFQVGSGGEGITLPVLIHEELSFFAQDFKEEFQNGFYYGIIVLVIIIYFFFFLLLKDRTFLYYILYVFFQGLLQFSLDGYTFHHFFPSGGYWANRFPPFAGAFAIIFMLIYVNKFLNLNEKGPRFRKSFYIAGGLIGVSLIFIFLPNGLHVHSYPLINGISLISILLAVASIFYLHFKRVSVDIYFTIAFVSLISGAVIFILGNFNVIENSSISLNALKISSVVEIVVLSISMSYKYRELQKDKEEAHNIALKNLQEKNELMDQSNVLLEEQVKERTQEIERQKEELAVNNKEIVSSIRYAKRIQEAILPSKRKVDSLLSNSFIFYRPKDVVSGDFYFVEPAPGERNIEIRGYSIFAVVDCTGHGVPGAFMSIVGNSILTQSLTEPSVDSPAKALDYLNHEVLKRLSQKVDGTAVRDGMDIAMGLLNKERNQLTFSGAKSPLYLIRSKTIADTYEAEDSLEVKVEMENCILYQITADKQPIGNSAVEDSTPYKNHTINLHPTDQIYLFTDGYADQFGGPNGKKYNYRRFRELLLSCYGKSMEEQEKRIKNEFDNWLVDWEQIDDVLVLSVLI